MAGMAAYADWEGIQSAPWFVVQRAALMIATYFATSKRISAVFSWPAESLRKMKKR